MFYLIYSLIVLTLCAAVYGVVVMEPYIALGGAVNAALWALIADFLDGIVGE